MARSRVAEVLYRLRDLFSGPAERIGKSYDQIANAATSSSNRVSAANRKIQKSLGGVRDRLRDAAKAFAIAFTGRAIGTGVSAVADELDRLGKTAARLNLDPNTLAALEFAAERSGLAVGRMADAIQELQQRTGEALQGTGEAREAFDRLGISATDFADLNAEQKLLQIADALQLVTIEEERAAVASQLFSEANVDLLNVLNQGGAGFKALIDEGKRYRQVTDEQVEAAARYNDALTNLNTKLEGLRNQIVPPIIEELADFFDNVGIGDPIAGLTAELIRLEDVAKRPIDVFLLKNIAGNDIEARIDAINKKLRELYDEQKKADEASDQERQARAEQIRANEAYTQTVDDLTDSYEAQVKAQQKALDMQTAELRAARTEQAKIEQEFKSLVDNIIAPDIESVGLGDVFGKINQAAAKAEQGQADEAIAIAREGGRFLELLAEKGTESDLVLKFLGERLAAVAKEAASQKVQAELIDQDQAQQAVDGVKNKLEALKSDAVEQGQAAGRAFIDALQTELATAQVTLPPINVSTSGQQAAQSLTSQVNTSLAENPPAAPTPSQPRREPRIVREGNSFFYSYMREKEQRGAK